MTAHLLTTDHNLSQSFTNMDFSFVFSSQIYKKLELIYILSYNLYTNLYHSSIYWPARVSVL